MFMTGVGTAAPDTTYTQAEGWRTLQNEPRFLSLTGRSRSLLRKVLLGDNGIETRHLVLDNLQAAFALNPDVLHARFLQHAPTLATAAANRALETAGTAPGEIGALLISTCTGYLCPGLTSYVSEKLGLGPQALLLDLVGQGCGAAIPNWRAAEALLSSGTSKKVLSVCVEICSACFYLDDDPGVLISACLFGDGAGACVFSNEPGGAGRRVRYLAARTLLRPAERDALWMEQRNGMFRNVLSPRVPELAAQAVEEVLSGSLEDAGLTRSQVVAWLLHPGGRVILDHLGRRLHLPETDLAWSAGVMRGYGNLSSASLYFVLKRALDGSAPSGYWWASSFGAGFSCHGQLLEVE